jgi:acyl carrier protein
MKSLKGAALAAVASTAIAVWSQGKAGGVSGNSHQMIDSFNADFGKCCQPKIGPMIPFVNVNPKFSIDPGRQANESSAQSHDGKKKLSPAEQVKQIIVETLGVDASEVKPDANFRKDLGADDLDMTILVKQFEESFNLQIPDEDAKKFEIVRDATNYIEKRLANKN